MRLVLRDLNVHTSQSVFVGPYLTETQRKEFADNYLKLNDGFLSFPLNIPGTTLYKAAEARKKVKFSFVWTTFSYSNKTLKGCCYII